MFRSWRSVPPSKSNWRLRSTEPSVTMPNARRASIAPEARVQFAFWNGPPSNWLTSGTRGKPSGVVPGGGEASRSASAAAVRSPPAIAGRTTAVCGASIRSNAATVPESTWVSLKSGASPAVGTAGGGSRPRRRRTRSTRRRPSRRRRRRAWAGGRSGGSCDAPGNQECLFHSSLGARCLVYRGVCAVAPWGGLQSESIVDTRRSRAPSLPLPCHRVESVQARRTVSAR